MNRLKHNLAFVAAWTVIMMSAPVWGEPGGGGGRTGGSAPLSNASLEELMNLEISSVSRKEQRLSQTAAAVFVITQDDIRRSGAVSLPEVLRLAPGLHVARIDAGKWAVSSRGFNGRFANKMQVMIDGRSIYTQLYSGVYWDQYDILLEDIERIEIIRGPGATSWGANAVNGVINIITKSAGAVARGGAQGGMVTASGGPVDEAMFGAQFGGQVRDRLRFRASTRLGGWQRDFHTERGSGRLEWDITGRDLLTLQGDLYQGGSTQIASESIVAAGVRNPRREPVDFAGGSLQTRWRRTGERSETALQWYLNEERRREGVGEMGLRTLDLDFQNRNAVGRRHDLIWGAGYRSIDDHIKAVSAVAVSRPRRETGLASSFLQDDIRLAGDKLVLTVGSKFLYQEYSGFDWQPGARLLFAPSTRQSFWTSVTRAVRTPSRRDQDISFEFPFPSSVAGQAVPQGVYGRYQGNPDFGSERAVSWEAGYRRQFGERFSLDVAAFRSRYRDLESLAMGSPEVRLQPFRVTVPLVLGNKERAVSQGGELVAQWKPAASLRFSGSYSFLSMKREGTAGSFTFLRGTRDPRHQAQGHAAWDLTRKVGLDVFVFGVSNLAEGTIPAYVRADVRLSWKVTERAEFAVGGRNLLDSRHPEFISEDFVVPQEVRRSGYVRLTWRF